MLLPYSPDERPEQPETSSYVVQSLCESLSATTSSKKPSRSHPPAWEYTTTDCHGNAQARLPSLLGGDERAQGQHHRVSGGGLSMPRLSRNNRMPCRPWKSGRSFDIDKHRLHLLGEVDHEVTKARPSTISLKICSNICLKRRGDFPERWRHLRVPHVSRQSGLAVGLTVHAVDGSARTLRGSKGQELDTPGLQQEDQSCRPWAPEKKMRWTLGRTCLLATPSREASNPQSAWRQRKTVIRISASASNPLWGQLWRLLPLYFATRRRVHGFPVHQRSSKRWPFPPELPLTVAEDWPMV